MKDCSTNAIFLCFWLLGFAVFGNCVILSVEECEAGFEIVGQREVERSLSWCLLGNDQLCCEGIGGLFGVGSGTPIGGCLCHNSVVEEIVVGAEKNPLAVSLGFNEERILDILTTCNADFGSSASCRSPTQSPPADPVVEARNKIEIKKGKGDKPEKKSNKVVLEVPQVLQEGEKADSTPSQPAVKLEASSKVKSSTDEMSPGTVKTEVNTVTSVKSIHKNVGETKPKKPSNKVKREFEDLGDEELMAVLTSKQDKENIKERISSETSIAPLPAKKNDADAMNTVRIGRTSVKRAAGPVSPKVTGSVTAKTPGRRMHPTVISNQIHPIVAEAPLLPKRSGGPMFPTKTPEVVYLQPVSFQKPQSEDGNRSGGGIRGKILNMWKKLASHFSRNNSS